MAGTEIFGKEEIMAAADVIERRMIHRYGSHAERAGVYRAEEFEAAAREITGSKYALAELATGAMSQNAALAAQALGLEARFTTSFNRGAIEETLNLGPVMNVVGVLAVGRQ